MLPQLNVTPKYEFLIPSLGKMVKFRPYLVKEQKVLLIALQEQVTSGIVNAMITAVESCIEDTTINVRSLPMFDIKYLFLKLRTKSVQDKSDVVIKCKDCARDNKYTIDISTLEIHVPLATEFNIQLDEGIVMKMKYPTANDTSMMVSGNFADLTDFEKIIAIMKSSCVHIQTPEHHQLVSDVTFDEFAEWVGNMSAEQFNMVKDFVESIPDIKHEVNFKCVGCGVDNTTMLKGTDDFFS